MKLGNAIRLIVLFALFNGCTNSGEKVSVVSDVTAGFGKSAVWNPQMGQLCWVDVTGKILNLYNPVLGMHRELYLGQLVFSVAPIETGELLVLLENDVYTLNPTTGTKLLLASFPEALGNILQAVGAVDPDGRFWVSITSKEEGTATTLFRIEEAEVAVIIDRGIGMSGGMSWSADKTLLYYLDSEERRLISFAYDLQTGSIGQPGKAVLLDSETGIPTGVASDLDGNLWIGQWGISAISCYNPLNGEILSTIDLPVNYSTSLTFGDSDMGTLYITSAKTNLDGELLSDNGTDGRLLRVRPQVGGATASVISNL